MIFELINSSGKWPKDMNKPRHTHARTQAQGDRMNTNMLLFSYESLIDLVQPRDNKSSPLSCSVALEAAPAPQNISDIKIETFRPPPPLQQQQKQTL